MLNRAGLQLKRLSATSIAAPTDGLYIKGLEVIPMVIPIRWRPAIRTAKALGMCELSAYPCVGHYRVCPALNWGNGIKATEAIFGVAPLKAAIERPATNGARLHGASALRSPLVRT